MDKIKRYFHQISGMFIDNLVDVAKRELAWEVDYEREAECTKKFKQLLAPFPQYYVPEVIGIKLNVLNYVESYFETSQL